MLTPIDKDGPAKAGGCDHCRGRWRNPPDPASTQPELWAEIANKPLLKPAVTSPPGVIMTRRDSLRRRETSSRDETPEEAGRTRLRDKSEATTSPWSEPRQRLGVVERVPLASHARARRGSTTAAGCESQVAAVSRPQEISTCTVRIAPRAQPAQAGLSNERAALDRR